MNLKCDFQYCRLEWCLILCEQYVNVNNENKPMNNLSARSHKKNKMTLGGKMDECFEFYKKNSVINITAG